VASLSIFLTSLTVGAELALVSDGRANHSRVARGASNLNRIRQRNSSIANMGINPAKVLHAVVIGIASRIQELIIFLSTFRRFGTVGRGLERVRTGRASITILRTFLVGKTSSGAFQAVSVTVSSNKVSRRALSATSISMRSTNDFQQVDSGHVFSNRDGKVLLVDKFNNVETLGKIDGINDVFSLNGNHRLNDNVVYTNNETVISVFTLDLVAVLDQSIADHVHVKSQNTLCIILMTTGSN